MINAIAFLLSAAPALAGGKSLPPPGWVAPPEVSFESVPASASKRPDNQPGKPHQVHARLVLDQETVQPGGTVRVGLRELPALFRHEAPAKSAVLRNL